MNILVVSPYLPHPASGHGTGIILHGLLRHLAPRHQVTLLSFCDDRERRLASDLRLPVEVIIVPRGRAGRPGAGAFLRLASVRSLQFLWSLLTWKPYYVAKYRNRKMARMVSRLTDERAFDIVQFEMSHMGRYLRNVKKGRTVLHEHDVSFRPAYRRYRRSGAGPKKFAWFVEWCRWFRYERAIVPRFDHTLCVTEQDVRLLERFTGSTSVSYLPRGVDVPDRVPDAGAREPGSLLFVGTFSHQPNVDAAMWTVKEIFPLVLRTYPGATLSIIGLDPPEPLRAAAASFSGVKILGFVDDVNPYLRKCAVFIAPLRYGGGVKVKILHALAQGIPVVTTKVGAEGIEGLSDGGVLIGDSSERLADHICTLFRDPRRASELARKGWDIVRNSYTWEAVTKRLEDIYGRILSPEREGA